MSYNLTFEIEPDIYRRAMRRAPTNTDTAISRLSAATMAAGFTLGLGALTLVLFGPGGLLPALFGAVLGAAGFLAVMKRVRIKAYQRQESYNAAAGRHEMEISARGLVVRRPGIESRIAWSYVRGITEMEGATLIELPTAQLIVPDTALSAESTPEMLRADLEAWRADPVA